MLLDRAAHPLSFIPALGWGVRRNYPQTVTTTHQRLRRRASGLGIIALPILGLVLAPPGLATDDCVTDPETPQCVQSGTVPPGDASIPNGGPPPPIAAGPANPGAPTTDDGIIYPIFPPLGGPGGPFTTVDGDLIVPVAPPLGPGAPIITVDGDFIVPLLPPLGGPGGPFFTMDGF